MKTYLRVAFVLLIGCVTALPQGACCVFGDVTQTSVETAQPTSCCHHSNSSCPIRQPGQPLKSATTCCCVSDMQPVEKLPPLKLDQVLSGISVPRGESGATNMSGELLSRPLPVRAGCRLQILLGVWRC